MIPIASLSLQPLVRLFVHWRGTSLLNTENDHWLFCKWSQVKSNLFRFSCDALRLHRSVASAFLHAKFNAVYAFGFTTRLSHTYPFPPALLQRTDLRWLTASKNIQICKSRETTDLISVSHSTPWAHRRLLLGCLTISFYIIKTTLSQNDGGWT